jgi:hypothetical protein
MINRLMATPRANWNAGRVPSLTERTLDRPQHEFVHSMALDVFTTMANSGAPFAACIAAVYMTGLDHGSKALRAQIGGDR